MQMRKSTIWRVQKSGVEMSCRRTMNLKGGVRSTGEVVREKNREGVGIM